MESRGTHGLIVVKSNADLDKEEKAEADRRQRLIEGNENSEELRGLASYINKCWEAALRAKESRINTILINSLRQRNGEYDPGKLQRIRDYGGSEIYMLLTNVKCRAAEGWIKDVLIPPGEKPWGLEPTPIPDLPAEKKKEIDQLVLFEAKEQMLQAGSFDAVSAEDMTDRLYDLWDETLEDTLKKSRKVVSIIERQIEDELVEGNYYNALIEFMNDIVTFPTAFMKGPIYEKIPLLQWNFQGTGATPVVREKIVRRYKRVSPFDIFPSPGARSMQDGFVIERHRVRKGDLLQMIGVPGFDAKMIGKLLKAFENRGNIFDYQSGVDQERREAEKRDWEVDDPVDMMVGIEFWGPVPAHHLKEWGVKDIIDDGREYNVQVWMFDRFVIMARLNPHPLGRRPYYGTSFEKVNDSIWGKGIPQLMRDIQDICNASARSLVNNMAIASGPQVEVMTDRLDPSEDAENVYPWKIWKTKDDGLHGKPAIQFFQPNPMTDGLLKVYDYFFKQASEVSGIPAYIYGSPEVSGAGRTASGLGMLMNAASKALKEVIKHIDDDVTRPSIYDHFVQKMLFDEDTPMGGDINVIARASEYLIIAEQLAVRRTEFLEKTTNEYDMQIIGMQGRAAILRELAKSLKLPEGNIVPTERELAEMQAQQKQQEQQMQEQQMAMGNVQLAQAVAGLEQEAMPPMEEGSPTPQGTPEAPAARRPDGAKRGVVES